jgi:hypothetical protein
MRKADGPDRPNVPLPARKRAAERKSSRAEMESWLETRSGPVTGCRPGLPPAEAIRSRTRLECPPRSGRWVLV